MKKKLLSTLIAASMVAAALAGCAAPAATATAPAADSAAPAAEASSDAASGDEAVTLKWALWDKDTTVYYQPLIDAHIPM